MDMHTLQEAITIIKDAKLDVAKGSAAVWSKLNHAQTHLEGQLRSLLSE